MRKTWLRKDFDHIPIDVKEKLDCILTKKWEAEDKLNLSKKCLNLATVRATTWGLSEDNTAENIEADLKKKMEMLIQAYVAYYQLDREFDDLLSSYRKLEK